MPRIGILDGLSPEQQEQLIDWIETMPIKLVVEKSSTPPPEGLGIKTHITSLRRFYQRYQVEHLRDDLAVAASVYLTSDNLQSLRTSAMAVLTHHAFESATAPNFDGSHLPTAARWLNALREHELREQRLALARERLELEKEKLRMAAVFKQADCVHPDDIQSIREAAQQLFKSANRNGVG